jgi:hypothetical protein
VATRVPFREGEPVTEGLPDEADALYELDPSEFTAARNALVKRLRADKRRDEATAVAALKRPSPVAWALNQLARRSPQVIEAALDAVEELQAATDAAVAGEPGNLRPATTAERAATNDVVDAAREHLGTRTEGLRQAIVGTLRAAGADPDVAATLRAGTLSTEHDPAGFGFGSDLGGFEAAAAALPAAQPKAAKKTAPTRTSSSSTDDAAAERTAAAAEKAATKARAEAAKEAERLARTAERLEQAADRAERTAQVADDGASLAEEAARDARADADEAKDRATEARADAQQARADADEAAASLAEP